MDILTDSVSVVLLLLLITNTYTAHHKLITAYPDDGTGDGNGDSEVVFLFCEGDSEGDGSGSTAPEGGGYRPRVSDKPIRT